MEGGAEVSAKYYMARIPLTGYFVRCPRWFYNRWPWLGIVQYYDTQEKEARK